MDDHQKENALKNQEEKSIKNQVENLMASQQKDPLGRQENWKWKCVARASITVEAAYVMPIVIFAVFAVIYLAFYLHDYCILQGAVDRTVRKADFYSNQVSDMEMGEIYYEAINSRGVFYPIFGDSSDMEGQMRRVLKQGLEGRLFLYDVVSTHAEADQYKIELILSAKRKINLPIFGKVFRSFEAVSITGGCSIHRPAETVRFMEVIMDTASEIKGVSELKEKLEKFLKGN